MIRQLLRLAGDRRPVRRYAALLLASAVLRAGATLSLVPVLAAAFSDSPAAALPWVLVLAALVAAGWAVDHTLARTAFSIGFGLLSTVEERVVTHLRRVPLGWLTAPRRADARRALTASGQELCQGMNYLITPAANALVTPALIGLGLLAVAWPLGVAALLAVPVLLATLWVSGRTLAAADDAFAAAAGEAGERVVEFAQAQPALRAAGQSGADGSVLGTALARQRRAALRLLGYSVPGQLLFGLVTPLVILGLAATTVTLAVRGQLTAPEAVALVVVVIRFVEPFTSLADLSPALQAMRGTLGRVDATLAAPVLAHPDRSAVPDPAAPALEFQDVTFGYEPGRDTVAGVTFTVPRGTTTAVVGPSGSGKSTLLALVARFHEAGTGQVLVAGHDVRGYDPGTLTGQLGIVFQDVYLFDATLRDNIRLGRPDAPDAEIRAAAALAQLDEVVDRLPAGWDTRVGEGGAALSGGERQRVSIARALLKDAPLLLLDEATAALDTLTEQALVAALESGSSRRGTVIVAHRLTTIARADRILFLEAGRVVEAGTLPELLAADGKFAAYWRHRETAAGWSLAQGRR
ncbi:ABC transporter ATP-binding protein [Longispora sp. NPDC051575]|uniref:ABC transporter ATP-binding protein n=1 Tax=Longispora sp. NPDC051575 TaxID=3154943 RepID=UPI003442A4B2